MLKVYTCDINFRQFWIDPGMNYTGIIDESMIYVPEEFLPQFWTPDTFIENSKETTEHTVTQPNRGLFVYGNGVMMYSIR